MSGWLSRPPTWSLLARCWAFSAGSAVSAAVTCAGSSASIFAKADLAMRRVDASAL